MLTIVAQTMTGPTPMPFTGDRALAQQFLDEFWQFERANLRHVLITRPALRVELALSFIRGPLTDPWKQTVQRGSPGDTEDEKLWDEFYDSFCTAWTDDLPVPVPQTPSPLESTDATAVPSPDTDNDFDFKESYASFLNDNAGIFSPRTPTPTPSPPVSEEEEDETLYAPRTSAPPPSILDVLRPLTPTAPSPPTLADDDGEWTLFAPRVVSVLTPLVTPTAPRIEKRKQHDPSDEEETRPSKHPRIAPRTGPPRARPQLARRSVPLPRRYAFAPRRATSAPVTSAPSFIVPYSPPPRRPPSPPDDPGPPVPAALPPGSRHTIVEDDNNRRGGVKTLDSSVFAPDVAVSPTPTPVLDSPRPPTPRTPPPRRPDIFPRLALEMPRDPDSLATHPTNSRRRGNAHPRTPAQTTTDTPSTTVDPVNTPPTRLAPVSAQNAVDSPRRPRLAPLTPADREKCRHDGLCFRCRQHGHTTATCPQNATRQPPHRLGIATTQTQPRSQPVSDRDVAPPSTPPPRPSNPIASRNRGQYIDNRVHAWLAGVIYEPPPRTDLHPARSLPPPDPIAEERADYALRNYGYEYDDARREG
ncbi:hypothetical protein EDB83DRAFT_2519986 [Lactarius deliciosus]|nr:hypothetical protein EDB83DRAFT_2519986 [Lactarius deliciosus]